MSKDYAIIVAGGKGLRMKGIEPKQFMLLDERPVLMRTMERFHEGLPDAELIVVLPEVCLNLWNELKEKFSFVLPHQVVTGGDTRFASVRNGLCAISDDAQGVVGVHDGVRPFVSVEVIRHCFAEAREKKGVVPVLKPVESIRIVTDETGESSAFDRDRCFLVQTPQVFSVSLLKKAYRQPYCESFTDDASVVEAIGCHVSLVEGNRENIKLTSPFDWIVAQAIINKV